MGYNDVDVHMKENRRQRGDEPIFYNILIFDYNEVHFLSCFLIMQTLSKDLIFLFVNKNI